MEMQRQFSDCFLWIEEEVNSPKIKSQLSVGGISQLCGAPIESLDFIKVWISQEIPNLGFFQQTTLYCQYDGKQHLTDISARDTLGKRHISS